MFGLKFYLRIIIFTRLYICCFMEKELFEIKIKKFIILKLSKGDSKVTEW